MNTQPDNGMKLGENTVVFLGLIIMLIKMAATYGFVWMICMFSILGIETLRLGKNVIEVGFANLPSYYYISSLWFSLALFGLAQFLRQAIMSGFFNLVKSEDQPTNTEK